MKKVILLSESPNPEGNTVQVFRECAKVMGENGVETEIISLSGMNLKDLLRMYHI